MDTQAFSSCDQFSLINELTQGMEVAKQLKAQMGPEYSLQSKEMLLHKIVTSYDKALYILGCGGPTEQPHQLLSVALPVMPLSPVSAMGSTKSEGKQTPKKRKAASTWTQQVTVNTGTNTESPQADGYSWRKYGQKDILGTKHPRSYYRCTYRNVHDCWATKQVQKSDEDPTVFHITYKGKHTCTTVASRSKSAPTSPGKKQEAKPELLNMEYPQDAATGLSFQNAPITDTQNIDCTFPFSWREFGYLNGESSWVPQSTISNTDNFYGSFSISPSTSDSNYFSMSPCTTDTFASLQHQEHNNFETDISEMLSATISATNSPTLEQLDTWSFNPNLPVNNL